jgi:histidine triad (HIT) family protein
MRKEVRKLSDRRTEPDARMFLANISQEERMEECLFCNIQQGLIPTVGGSIYEDDLVYAHHYYNGEEPTYLGHLLLETKRHTPDFADLTTPEAQTIGLLITRLSHALKACTGAEKVYEVFYGEVIPHLHIHLTARYPGTPPEYLRGNIEDWPMAPGGNVDEIAALCQRLRSMLTNNLS